MKERKEKNSVGFGEWPINSPLVKVQTLNVDHKPHLIWPLPSSLASPLTSFPQHTRPHSLTELSEP